MTRERSVSETMLLSIGPTGTDSYALDLWSFYGPKVVKYFGTKKGLEEVGLEPGTFGVGDYVVVP